MAIRGVGGQSSVDFSQVDSAQSAQSAASAAPAASSAPAGRFAPGSTAPKSGQYVLVDARGKQVGKEYTMTKGTTFPPARPGLNFKLVDSTKHSSATGVGGLVGGAPGDKAPRSGQYVLFGANGPVKDYESTVTRGEPFPPTPKAGQLWILADATGTKRPGEKAEISGQYALVDARGKTIKDKEVTIQKGDSFPATPKMGQAWKIVDITRHESDPKFSGVKPGSKAPASGQYELLKADGTRTGREVTVVKGEPLPPTRGAGMTYRLVDNTK